MATRLDTYANFTLQVIEWLNVASTDFATAQFDDAAKLAQKRIEAELRIRESEKAFSAATVTAGVVAVPADYLELKQAYVTIGGVIHKLERTETDNLYRIYNQRSQTGNPILIARDGDNFVFGPVPADGVSLTGRYYRSWPDITATTLSLINSASADYNSLFAKWPHLFVYATCVELTPGLRDPQFNLWEAKYQNVKTLAERSDRAERFSGSPLATKVL